MTGRVALAAASLTVAFLGLSGDRSAVPAPAVGSLGPTPASTPITFALSLKMNDRALDRVFDAVGKHRAPAITPAEVGRRYGVPLAAEARVERTLRLSGVTVLRSYPQRTEIDARASVGTLSRVFRIHFRDYTDPAGNRFHAPTGAPTVPSAISPWVTGVVGLSTRQLFSPADVRGGGLVPVDAALAYDTKPLRDAGVDGSGLTIAIASFQRFDDSDVKSFAGKFRLKGPTPQHVVIGSGAEVKGAEEADLDVETIQGIAPGAQIVNYEAPKTLAGELAMLNKIAAAPAALASDSWGLCDSGLGSSTRSSIEHALRAAVLNGTTFFVASGDTGAYDCQRSNFADHKLTVDFPADSPNVVAVGGTQLAVNSDGTYLAEHAWEDPLENAGGGGGISPNSPAPPWQLTYKVAQGKTRVLPDVSADADVGSGWAVVIDGQTATVGGTSAAAPFWAASMLLAQQYGQTKGVKKRCFMAPLLYELAYTKQPFAAFHDVVTGANRHYDAGRGWDYATGLGSPDVYNLARDLATARLAHHGACDASG